MPEINSHALDVLFNVARTYNAWQDKPVDAGLLKQIYDLTKMAPTSANCQPLRVIYVVSKEAKEKLRPCLDKGNVDKTIAAPATAILAMDMKFYDHSARLFPIVDLRSWFVNEKEEVNEAYAASTRALIGAK